MNADEAYEAARESALSAKSLQEMNQQIEAALVRKPKRTGPGCSVFDLVKGWLGLP